MAWSDLNKAAPQENSLRNCAWLFQRRCAKKSHLLIAALHLKSSLSYIKFSRHLLRPGAANKTPSQLLVWSQSTWPYHSSASLFARLSKNTTAPCLCVLTWVRRRRERSGLTKRKAGRELRQRCREFPRPTAHMYFLRHSRTISHWAVRPSNCSLGPPSRDVPISGRLADSAPLLIEDKKSWRRAQAEMLQAASSFHAARC